MESVSQPAVTERRVPRRYSATSSPVPVDRVLRSLALSVLRTRPLLPVDASGVTQARYRRQRRKARLLRRVGEGGLPLVRLCPRHYVGPDGTVYAKAMSGALWPIT